MRIQIDVISGLHFEIDECKSYFSYIGIFNLSLLNRHSCESNIRYYFGDWFIFLNGTMHILKSLPFNNDLI